MRHEETAIGSHGKGTLYPVISAAFCVIVVLSNILSAKMVLLPYVGFAVPAGLIVYPLTFLVSDLVTEVYGAAKARAMVYTAFGMCLLSVALVQATLLLPGEGDSGAFHAVLGLSGLRTFSSLAAYLSAQLVDIQVYAWIRRCTGPKWLWLRNNGATFISQLVDTAVIDILFLYWGLGMEMAAVWPVMVFSYLYKTFFGLAATPLFYLCVFWIGRQRGMPMRVMNLAVRRG